MCKCERGLKFEIEHAREATWSEQQLNRRPSSSKTKSKTADADLSTWVASVGKMVSLQALFRAYSFGTFCFQQTTAEILKP